MIPAHIQISDELAHIVRLRLATLLRVLRHRLPAQDPPVPAAGDADHEGDG
ncbi:MAG TPA: hypothetical protein VMC83_16845 [Streptosporangiaceae bacterium]|nr:hypothetical protein [Streptosporangiaceae bacterium]